MKKFLFIFLIGAAAGAYGFYYVQQKNAEAAKTAEKREGEKPGKATTLTDRVRNDAKSVGDSVANKLTEWHLTPDAIGEELQRTGQVVRNKAQSAGESIASASSNARIVAVIKAKLALDKELSARSINVDCDSGQVTLHGTVANNGLIAKAVGVALDTDGVIRVKSLLKVAPPDKT